MAHSADVMSDDAKVWIFKEVTALRMHLLSVDQFQSSKYGVLPTPMVTDELLCDKNVGAQVSMVSYFGKKGEIKIEKRPKDPGGLGSTS